MTHLEKLEAVRQEIIREVPEIAELKFGCVIKCEEQPDAMILTLQEFKAGTSKIKTHFCSKKFPNLVYEGDSIELPGCFTFEEYQKLAFQSFEQAQCYSGIKFDWRIIGRDIQLHDVLRTIKEKDEEKENELLLLATNGTFVKFSSINPLMFNKSNIHWNLLKPLEDQPEPVINFLHEILCV